MIILFINLNQLIILLNRSQGIVKQFSLLSKKMFNKILVYSYPNIYNNKYLLFNAKEKEYIWRKYIILLEVSLLCFGIQRNIKLATLISFNE